MGVCVCHCLPWLVRLKLALKQSGFFHHFSVWQSAYSVRIWWFLLHQLHTFHLNVFFKYTQPSLLSKNETSLESFAFIRHTEGGINVKVAVDTVKRTHSKGNRIWLWSLCNLRRDYGFSLDHTSRIPSASTTRREGGGFKQTTPQRRKSLSANSSTSAEILKQLIRPFGSV